MKMSSLTLPSVQTAPDTRQRAPVVALLSAQAISDAGNTITALAIPWFVFVTTGSAARTGVIAFAGLFPFVVAAILGGALVDRVGNKQMSVIADVLSGLTVAAVPLLYLTVGLEFWELFLLVFLGGILDSPGSTARMSLVPNLAERAKMPLERVNSASQAITSSSRLIGPIIAGGLIAIIGASKVLWADAASFAISAVIVAALVPGTKPVATEHGRYFEDVLAGLRFLKEDRLLRTIVMAAAATNFLDAPLFSPVLPVFAKEQFGSASDLGFMLAGLGAGAIAGALIYGSVGAKFPKRPQLVAFFVLFGLPLFILAASHALPVAIGAMALLGLATGGINPLALTAIQERTPPEMLARVFGSVMASALIAAPLGALLGGVAVETFGVTKVIVLIGALIFAVGVWLSTQKALAELDEQISSRSPDEAT
jgi:MFS family permease